MTRPGKFALILPLLLLLLLPGVLRPAPAAAGTAVAPFGMGLYLYRVMGDVTMLNEMIYRARLANVSWTREEFNWSWIQPAAGTYDQTRLAQYDRMVDSCLAAGIQVLGVIAYQAPWDTGTNAPSTDEQCQRYADYVRFLVNRYKGKIKYWEIWNEPNTSALWKPDASQMDYARLLGYAYWAAKGVDPTVKILGCSTVGMDNSFIFGVLFYGVTMFGGPNMDIISVHPYPYPYPIELSQEIDDVELIRQTSVAVTGRELPVWITETGYTTYTGSRGVTWARQAQLAPRTYVSLLSKGVEGIFWYDFKEDGTSPTEFEHHFGLITNEAASPPLEYKNAFHTFSVVAKRLWRHKWWTSQLAGENVATHYFYREADNLITLVLWVQDYSVPSPYQYVRVQVPGQLYSVENSYGYQKAYNPLYRALGLWVDGSPVYIRYFPGPDPFPWELFETAFCKRRR